jgi:A/G-specific adenine glycosylase
MLQQTRVETVIPYYHRFLEQFPTIADLAAAPEEAVLKVWEGLGYYRRVKLFQQGARQVVAEYGGQLPAEPEQLAALPGIGSYMVGALASIAFNRPVPAVDGNVIRLVSRLLAFPEDSTTGRSRRIFTDWIQARFPAGAARDFTQGLMELGALICLPKAPRCDGCPVRRHCRAMAAGDPERFPVKKTARPIPTERRIVLCINWNGRRLFVRRPDRGLLAGFWEYPNLLGGPATDAARLAAVWTGEQLGRELAFAKRSELTQVFTHRRWEIELWEAEWSQAEPPATPLGGAWLSRVEASALPRVAFLRQWD